MRYLIFYLLLSISCRNQSKNASFFRHATDLSFHGLHPKFISIISVYIICIIYLFEERKVLVNLRIPASSLRRVAYIMKIFRLGFFRVKI